ncbi:hypothetical protein FJY71_02170 [candidate division WOR-3 bacterium]|nr:hypothetical protein [candidate division WOR-3 bacterium]
MDLATGAVVTRVVSGSRPVALARSPATGLVYCANGGTADVAVISSDGVRVLATLPVCGSGFTFAPRLRRAYLPRSWGWVYVLRDTLGVPCVSERGRVPRLRSLAASQNPFRKRVDLALPRTVSDSRLDVYSADGTFVRGLPILAGGGFSRCTWDGDDSRGREVPAGIYTIVLRQGTSCCARVRLTKLH